MACATLDWRRFASFTKSSRSSNAWERTKYGNTPPERTNGRRGCKSTSNQLPTATATNCNCGHLQLTNCNWHHLQLDQLQLRPTAGPCSRAAGRLDLCLRSQAQDEHRPGLRRRHQHYQQRENRPRLPRRRPRKQCKKAKQSRQERRRWWSSTSRAATTRENEHQHDKAKIQIKPT